MRTDLTRFCVPCGFRLPSQTQACPRCAEQTLERLPAAAEPKTKWVGKIEAWRLLVTWWPAVLVYVLSVAGAVHLVFFQTPGAEGTTLHAWVIGAGLMGGFLGVAIILGLIWAAWAVFITLTFFFVPRETTAPQWLAVASPQRAVSSTKRATDRFAAWIDRLGWRSAVLPLLVWLGIELLAQLVSDPGWFVRGSLKDVAVMCLLVAGGTIVSWALLAPGIGFALGLLSKLLLDLERNHANLRLLGHAAPERPESKPATDGVVAEGVTCIAPISGSPCAGFRLTGEVDGFQIDDAWLSDFVIESADQTARVATQGARLIAATKAPEELDLDLDQKWRLTECLSTRGLPSADSVRLAETRIEVGASVRVWGEEGEEKADASAGYRERARRTVIEASSERPLVIALD